MLRPGDREGIGPVRGGARRRGAVDRHFLFDLQAADLDLVVGERSHRNLRRVVRFDCYLNTIFSDQRHSIRILAHIFGDDVFAGEQVVHLDFGADAVGDGDRPAR